MYYYYHNCVHVGVSPFCLAQGVDTFRTLVAYHILSGLLPLLSAKGVTDSSRSLWLERVHFTVDSLRDPPLLSFSLLSQDRQDEHASWAVAVLCCSICFFCAGA